MKFSRDNYRECVRVVLDMPVRKRCCPGDVPAGVTVTLHNRKSPNRAWLATPDGCGHKIKLSRIKGEIVSD